MLKKVFYCELKRKGVTGTRYIPMGILSIAFEFQFHGAFQIKKLPWEGILSFLLRTLKKKVWKVKFHYLKTNLHERS